MVSSYPSDCRRVTVVLEGELLDELVHLIRQALSPASGYEVFVEQLLMLLREPIDPLVKAAVELRPVCSEAPLEQRYL
jgi:hypothetical protein